MGETDQDEIIKYCYNKANEKLAYSITLEELLETENFTDKIPRLVISDLRVLERDEIITLSGNFPLNLNLKFASISITIKGLLFWEEKNEEVKPVFTQLTNKYLKFVQEVELDRIELKKGTKAQHGTIDFSQVCKKLDEPSSDRIIFIQQKTDKIFTQNVGWSNSTGIIFYGKYEPFLTEQGRIFLEGDKTKANSLSSTRNELDLKREENGIINCVFPGESERITLVHDIDFYNISPQFYTSNAGMKLDDNNIWYGNNIYGEQIHVIAENTGLYIEKGKENHPKFIELKKAVTFKRTSFGAWEVIRVKNHGGQAIIYEVRKEGSTNNFALKSYRISGNNPYQQKRLNRYKSEVFALKKVKNCENVINLIDEGGEEKTPNFSDFYFVIELADNNLADYIKNSKFDLDEIFRFYRQTLNAFQCIHKEGIIHRDIKPQNILIKDSEIKVSDFGINFHSEDLRNTPKNEVVGPRFFICPESEDGKLETPDERCDIYSLGKLLYYLLSGGKTFSREKYNKPEYELSNIHNNNWFKVFDPFFSKTMVEERELRYSNITELKDAFEQSVDKFNKKMISKNFNNEKRTNIEYFISFESLKEEMIKDARKGAYSLNPKRTPDEVEQKIREDMVRNELEYPRKSHLYFLIANHATELKNRFKDDHINLEKGYWNVSYLKEQAENYKPIILKNYDQDRKEQSDHLIKNRMMMENALQDYFMYLKSEK